MTEASCVIEAAASASTGLARFCSSATDLRLRWGRDSCTWTPNSSFRSAAVRRTRCSSSSRSRATAEHHLSQLLGAAGRPGSSFGRGLAPPAALFGVSLGSTLLSLQIRFARRQIRIELYSEKPVASASLCLSMSTSCSSDLTGSRSRAASRCLPSLSRQSARSCKAQMKNSRDPIAPSIAGTRRIPALITTDAALPAPQSVAAETLSFS